MTVHICSCSKRSSRLSWVTQRSGDRTGIHEMLTNKMMLILSKLDWRGLRPPGDKSPSGLLGAEPAGDAHWAAIPATQSPRGNSCPTDTKTWSKFHAWDCPRSLGDIYCCRFLSSHAVKLLPRDVHTHGLALLLTRQRSICSGKQPIQRLRTGQRSSECWLFNIEGIYQICAPGSGDTWEGMAARRQS